MKYCQHCGRPIPQKAVYCQYCGGKQIEVDPQEHPVRHQATQPETGNDAENSRTARHRQVDSAPSSNEMDAAQLTLSDWGMLIANGFSGVLQLVYAIQAIFMPLSKGDGELFFCIFLAVIGAALSSLEGRECYVNRLPIWAAVLGCAGNVMGPLCLLASGSDASIIIGAILIGASFGLVKYQMSHFYLK